MQQHPILKSQNADEAYEKACAQLGEQPKALEQFVALHGEQDGQAHYSLHRITKVIKAVKDGKQLDYDNRNEWKYSPWFDMRKKNNSVPGSVFSFDGCGCGITYSGVGARLSSFSEEETEAIAQLMLQDYQNWMQE